MITELSHMEGVAAGVPYFAVAPRTRTPLAPVVVAWHMMDPPRTEAAFAAALPLEGLDAWRIYLGLPMSGSRLPPGGPDELMRLGAEDAVLKLQGPVITQAADEFPAAFAELRRSLNFGEGPLAVVGGSVGAAVAQLVMAESGLPIDAAVLVSPLVRLRSAIDSMAAQFGFTYPWPEAAQDLAMRLDFVTRAGDIAGQTQPAVLLVVGAEDDQDAFAKPAEALRDALAAGYRDKSRCRMICVPGMAHALAAEPGIEPAPQTPYAAEVDRQAVEWLGRHLASNH